MRCFIIINICDVETAHRVREVVGVQQQQPSGVDDGEPRLAHAAGGGDVARREASQDVGKGVVR
jgi:hypothetical protein